MKAIVSIPMDALTNLTIWYDREEAAYWYCFDGHTAEGLCFESDDQGPFHSLAEAVEDGYRAWREVQEAEARDAEMKKIFA